MYVSSEVRRREIPESTPDPSHHASSTSGASFLAILSEVGRTQDDFSDQVADRAHDVAPESPGDADSAERDPALTDESAVETNAPAVDETEEPEAVDAEATPTEPALPATPSNAPVTVAVTTPVAPAADAEAPIPVATTPVGSAPAEGLLADPLGLLKETETPASPAEPAAPVETSAESGVVESIEGAIDPDLPPAVTMELEVEPAPAAPAFPKTLNAILAEDALRPAAEIEAPETVPPASESSAALTETASDTATELPDSTPLPHATAMESGGVRPQTTSMPRLPMANLPGELAQQIHLMQQEGARSMRIRLVPENLGELQIEIQGTGDSMKVRLISGNPAVRDALESQMGDLKDAMEKQGLALDQGTVDGESNRRGQAPEPEHKPSGPPYREAKAPPEGGTGSTRRSAPMLPGSGALNVLA